MTQRLWSSPRHVAVHGDRTPGPVPRPTRKRQNTSRHNDRDLGGRVGSPRLLHQRRRHGHQHRPSHPRRKPGIETQNVHCSIGPRHRRRWAPPHGPKRCVSVLPNREPTLRETALHDRDHQPVATRLGQSSETPSLHPRSWIVSCTTLSCSTSKAHHGGYANTTHSPPPPQKGDPTNITNNEEPRTDHRDFH